MSHLLKTKQISIFKTEVAPRPPVERALDNNSLPSMQVQGSRFAIGVDMTPEEARQTRLDNYPYRCPSVENLPARKRGHHY